MLKKSLKGFYHKYHIDFLRRHPLKWMYCAWLTLKFIDKWNRFPAIIILGRISVNIKKGKNAFLSINSQLIFESWLNEPGQTTLSFGSNSKMAVDGDFIFGQGVIVTVSDSANLVLNGKKNESGSGITAYSVLMVRKHLTIGYDCIIAWNTFITDCDWHTLHGKKNTIPTIIGDHVWIGVGAKVLKGVTVGANSIITSNSVVIQGQYPESVLISGNPGKIKKTNIEMWSRDLYETEI